MELTISLYSNTAISCGLNLAQKKFGGYVLQEPSAVF